MWLWTKSVERFSFEIVKRQQLAVSAKSTEIVETSLLYKAECLAKEDGIPLSLNRCRKLNLSVRAWCPLNPVRQNQCGGWPQFCWWLVRIVLCAVIIKALIHEQTCALLEQRTGWQRCIYHRGGWTNYQSSQSFYSNVARQCQNFSFQYAS